MKKFRFCLVMICLFLCCLFISESSFAADESGGGNFWRRWLSRRSGETQEEVKQEPVKPKAVLPVVEEAAEVTVREEAVNQKAELTREEKIIEIKERLSSYPEIIDMLPGLSLIRGEGTSAVYSFGEPGQITRDLEDLDDETLEKLYVRVSQQATRLNVERIQKQIQQQNQIRNMENLRAATQGIATQATQPPSVPRVVSPPNIPQQVSRQVVPTRVPVPMSPPQMVTAPPTHTVPPSPPPAGRR